MENTQVLEESESIAYPSLTHFVSGQNVVKLLSVPKTP